MKNVREEAGKPLASCGFQYRILSCARMRIVFSLRLTVHDKKIVAGLIIRERLHFDAGLASAAARDRMYAWIAGSCSRLSTSLNAGMPRDSRAPPSTMASN